MGESRQELLAWLNGLLSLNVTKVEQCGTGAAYCQILDSIYLDVPMSRVKFNVNTDYMYLQNFKILQTTFAKHQIDRPVPVESLVKCKMQDNLEFLQWMKRHWDQYFPGVDYDPIARRKAAGGTGVVGGAPVSRTAASANSSARRPGAPAASAPRVAPRAGSAAGGGAVNLAMKQENETLKETVTGLEKERDFYFNKLREIEILMQNEVETQPELEEDENGLVRRLQTILYSTEEGFEIPEEGEGAVGGEEAGEEETF